VEEEEQGQPRNRSAEIREALQQAAEDARADDALTIDDIAPKMPEAGFGPGASSSALRWKRWKARRRDR
jgi:hypothetical protein